MSGWLFNHVLRNERIPVSEPASGIRNSKSDDLAEPGIASDNPRVRDRMPDVRGTGPGSVSSSQPEAANHKLCLAYRLHGVEPFYCGGFPKAKP